MLKGIRISMIGVAIMAISLIITHSVGLPHEISSFLMGMGCSISIVGAGKRFVEMRSK